MEIRHALEIRDISYAYRSDWLLRSVQTLKRFSLDVRVGESFGFLGHNGAGKTTTIKCITGLIRPRSGSISIFGVDAADRRSRQCIGYLPEQPYFYGYLTVLETMQMYAQLAGINGAERSAKIATALDLVKVSARSKSPMRSLSKGLTQRVGMAQAIVAEPKLLILDEPFSGLDPIGRKEFRDLLVHLKQQGTTIFMSSHILSDVEFLCERVSILSKGQLKGVFVVRDVPKLYSGSFELVVRAEIAAVGDLVKLAESSRSEEHFVRLLFTTREQAEMALSSALAQGVAIESFQFSQAGLEQLFMDLVNFQEAGGKELR